ncbi:DUF6580 family putative transport protein [Flavihumibacter petaseus]|uniref:Rod shape-determining protein MreD n=1 Tax=Flavihumibacter petaseus NBRC 106054 TaxID=1220578 RepID=A0A0E9N0T3_9BACT|nr:DUF6580 family putative transport protein [Flavihumibacter petaseus]GAO42970.1 hypothetical protein FPE01S_02_00750 [Flavihumibacter petaseus NBRC 106054]
MKNTRSILFAFLLLVVAAAIYRIIPNRPLGFAPHIAMALFGGAVIKDRKWAFALPVFSMFLSDCIFELLFRAGWSDLPGFYDGQTTNYILFALITFVGFAINRITIPRVLAGSLVAPLVYFVLSNTAVWMGGAGFQRPKTFDGWLLALGDGVPFLRGSIAATVVFSVLLFGAYYWWKGDFRPSLQPAAK